jgi:Tfp pilus assembly PilM family ATPase
MRQIPILSGFFNYLTAPRLPQAALSISETHVAFIALKRSGGDFEPRNLGVSRLPDGVVRASFTELNVAEEARLIDHLTKTASRAGMGGVKELSVSLPSGSARSMVIALDATPASRNEMAQMMEWKTERSLGQKFGDLRVNHTRLRDMGGRPQYLISAAAERVIAQYERIFERLGWQAGMIAPQNIGESQWLMRQDLEEDQVDYAWVTPERIEIRQRQAYVRYQTSFLIFTLTARADEFESHETAWDNAIASVRLREIWE